MIIYKYKLKHEELQTVPLTDGYEILDIQLQDGELCLWALVEPLGQTAEVPIIMVGTGMLSEYPLGIYLKSVQEGSFVWHFFEYLREETYEEY